MHQQALPRFADSLCRFLTTTGAEQFATGQWLKSLSDDELYRLSSLIGLALEYSNEGAWDDLALTCMAANGAERRLRKVLLTGDQLLERVTTLRVIATVEALRRKGRIKLKYDLTIQPDALVETEPSRPSYGRPAHFAH